MKLPFFLAKRFVAGETAAQAIEVVKALQADGIHATLDLLGENVKDLREADQAVDIYRDLFDDIQTAKIDSGVSIKLTQLGLDFGVAPCFERAKHVLDMASKRTIFVRLDMEGSNYTQATIDTFMQLLEMYPESVGLVLQSYLHRSIQDSEAMAAMKASIRVCKGAYKEPSSVAIQNMPAIRAQYKTMVKTLLHAGCKVGIATHDNDLIDWAISWTKDQGIDPSLFEFQMLFGLRRKKSRSLVAQGFKVRSYVPFGTEWFPYFYRRLRERKENIFFLLKGLIED